MHNVVKYALFIGSVFYSLGCSNIPERKIKKGFDDYFRSHQEMINLIGEHPETGIDIKFVKLDGDDDKDILVFDSNKGIFAPAVAKYENRLSKKENKSLESFLESLK